MIELLENRIAPAPVLLLNGITINGDTATWLDYDGDFVKMTWTGNPLTKITHNPVLPPTFTTIVPPDAVPGGVLVTEIALANANDSITITVAKNPRTHQGNGEVDIGYVDAAGIPLKSFVAPAATVLEFDAGTDQAGSLAVGTLSIKGYGTMNPEFFTLGATAGGPAGTDDIGELAGNVGTLHISQNIGYGELFVGTPFGASIGTITIGGSLNGIGALNAGTPGEFSGTLRVEGTTGSISIGKGIIGTGVATESDGVLSLAGSVNKLMIGGNIVGGSVQDSGRVEIAGSQLANVEHIMTIKGSIYGGSGADSGTVNLQQVGTLQIGGSVIGGSADGTGVITLTSADIITLGGSLIGGALNTSAAAFATGAIDVKGPAHTITVEGDIIAGTVAGGGTVPYSGAILVDGDVSALTVGGDIIGSNAQRVFILAEGTQPMINGAFTALKTVTLKGEVLFGTIESGHADDATLATAEEPNASIGTVTILGDYLHSSIVAGANNSNGDGAGEDGGVEPIDTASGAGALGIVKISGQILDDAAAAGYSGFEATTIAEITQGGSIIFKHGGTAPVLDPFDYIRILEL